MKDNFQAPSLCTYYVVFIAAAAAESSSDEEAFYGYPAGSISADCLVLYSNNTSTYSYCGVYSSTYLRRFRRRRRRLGVICWPLG